MRTSDMKKRKEHRETREKKKHKRERKRERAAANKEREGDALHGLSPFFPRCGFVSTG